MTVVPPSMSSRRWALLIVGLSVVACSPSNEMPQRNPDGSRAQPDASFQTVEETAEGYTVKVDPNDFVMRVDNPYFPLEPGRRWVLKGKTVEGKEIDTIEVLDETKEVME